MRSVVNQYGKRVQRLDTIYIGYDVREHDAVDVLIHSIRKNASREVNIVTINLQGLRRAGLYWRAPDVESTVWGSGEEKYMRDSFDGRPFSTDFSFSRFLVPALNQYEGFALFIDCDFFCRGDVCEIFDKYATDDAPPVRVVKHNQNDKVVDGSIKMYGTLQTKYSSKKNWSSAVLWNCGHPSNFNLTVADVSTKNGKWLHEFSWLKEEEIGAMEEKFNWLDKYSDESIDPVFVHFTTGGPWFDVWSPEREVDKAYVKEWVSYKLEMDKEIGYLNGN